MAAGIGLEGDGHEPFPSTVYSLNWLPIGGFCNIKGETGEHADDADSFGHQKAWKKLLVLVAGVAMNIILAAVLLSIGFAIGLPSDLADGIPPGATLVGAPQVVIQQVEAGSVAEAVKLQFGDAITALDGKPIANAKAVTDYVAAHSGAPIQVTVAQGLVSHTITLTPQVIPSLKDNKPRLGVALADVGLIRYSSILAIGKGALAAGTGLITIFVSFYYLIKEFVLGHGLAFDVSGPVGIASIVGTSARLGISYLINVTAMISLSLAALNILPIPALDGGRVLFVLIEKITRRKVSLRYEQLAHTIGFLVLLLLILVVTARDIIHLIR